MSLDLPPLPYRVATARYETADTATVELAPVGRALPPFTPGQFAMVYAFGVGEIAVSVSRIGAPGGGGGDHLSHTVRAVGAVSAALRALRPGDLVGLRGPFGTGWGLDRAAGQDVVVVGGGIGLAPLRPVVHEVLARPGDYGALAVLVGARTPGALIYRQEIREWQAATRVAVTVDRPAPGWDGHVGVVTAVLDRVGLRPDRTLALVCGPEVMMRHTARALMGRGVPAERIRVSLERNMRCGAGWCGHCQLGPLLLCRDGPVVPYDQAGPLLTVREL